MAPWQVLGASVPSSGSSASRSPFHQWSNRDSGWAGKGGSKIAQRNESDDATRSPLGKEGPLVCPPAHPTPTHSLGSKLVGMKNFIFPIPLSLVSISPSTGCSAGVDTP